MSEFDGDDDRGLDRSCRSARMDRGAGNRVGPLGPRWRVATPRTPRPSPVGCRRTVSPCRSSGPWRPCITSGPLSLGDLADKLLVTGGNVTYVMDRLEDQGLVYRYRSPEDRRVILAKLTEPRDGQLVAEAFPDHVEFVEHISRHLSVDEQETVSVSCSSVSAARRSPRTKPKRAVRACCQVPLGYAQLHDSLAADLEDPQHERLSDLVVRRRRARR